MFRTMGKVTKYICDMFIVTEEQYPYRPIVLEQEDPNFAEPIPSVTVAAGKTAELKCVIDNLGNYTVHLDFT